ncbi:MAG: hypothetical protein WC934_02510 [Acidithiobacillus sp.]|uniref:hypothetical protein n=1 Tax=Acidithiobacillus sp. TaxID=1872118 RepID=UPI003560AA91
MKTSDPSILAAESAPAVRSSTNATPAACVRPEQDMAHCGACSHFLPGQPLPGQSLGTCSLTGAGPPSGGSGYKACYPMAPRTCPSYEGNET